LECIQLEEQICILMELRRDMLRCVRDQNGNHVVQKCIETIPPNQLNFLLESFRGQVRLLSTHPYGCRVVQRILEHCSNEQTEQVLAELHEATEILVNDQYGNYVIQHILEHGRSENKRRIISDLQGKIFGHSQHKYASNVIEKCITHSTNEERTYLIEELCHQPEQINLLMKDQYANYVVQKCLDVADQNQRKLLMTRIRPSWTDLKKFTYGKHIMTKLDKFFEKEENSSSPSTSPRSSNED